MSSDSTTRDSRPTKGPSWLVVSGESGVRPLPLPDRDRIVIGRGADCDVVIDEPSLSRRHLALTLDPLTVEDLGSRNGTRLLGRDLVPNTPTTMPVGAIIEAGETQLMLHTQRPPAKAMHSEGVTSWRGGPILLDPAMKHLYGLLDLIAPTSLSVVIYGETGVGKEVFAEALRARSTRAMNTFLTVNCASLSGSLLESELFGHEKGAFTGAVQARAGIFETADGGTLFLDEIGELPLETQAKLLRVLENGEVMRLGSSQTRKVDVRFIAATNRDLHAGAATGAFRSDLLFRLNGFAVTIPPLRERKSEVLPLAAELLQTAAAARGMRAPQLGSSAQRALERHDWPGNVRELKLVIERALAVAGDGGVIEESSLMLTEMRSQPSVPVAAPTSLPPIGAPTSLRSSRSDHDKARVIEALERNSGNQTAAARDLGVSRRTLITKIEMYGLHRPRKR